MNKIEDDDQTNAMATIATPSQRRARLPCREQRRQSSEQCNQLLV